MKTPIDEIMIDRLIPDIVPIDDNKIIYVADHNIYILDLNTQSHKLIGTHSELNIIYTLRNNQIVFVSGQYEVTVYDPVTSDMYKIASANLIKSMVTLNDGRMAFVIDTGIILKNLDC